MEYRAYKVGDDGHLGVPTLFECDDDDAAVATVKSMLNGKPVELWQGTRLVVWCERFDDQIVALRPYELAIA